MYMQKSQSKKIAFLDRDGVINKKSADHEYVCSPEDFVFTDGIFNICYSLKQRGFEFIVITNQRGIAQGLYTEHGLKAIHDRMEKMFEERGISILDIFYCPHEKDVCQCRKPRDGMLRKAASAYDIDFASSLLISDSMDDIEMGKNFGIGKRIFVPSDKPEVADLSNLQ